MSETKVLQVMDRLNVGGAASHAILIASRMRPAGGRAGWDSLLVVGREGEHEGSMRPAAERAGAALHSIPALGREINPIYDLRVLWSLWRLLRQERPRVVHTHKSKAGVVGRLAARLAGVPAVVHTFHGHVLHGYFGRWKSAFYIWIERAMARLTDRIIAVSPRVKDDLVRLGVAPPEKIAVIRLGMDLSILAAKRRNEGGLRRELSVDASVPLIGLVARLAPVKDVPSFLRACRRIAAARPDALFVIVGDGELRQELESMTRELGLDKSVRWLGFREDMERIYPDLDVLCLTSVNEGSPVSLIEGLAAECPVVSTEVGGVADVVRHDATGLLVPAGSPDAFADAVLRLLGDAGLRARMAAAGRADVLSRYGADRMFDDLERLYREILVGRPSIVV